MIPEALLQQAQRWIAHDVDELTREELRAAVDRGDVDDLADRLAGSLEFGTAGLRGVLGAGCNRMNRAVVIRTTAGLAAYLLAQGADAASRGVVVGYDARHMSREFAEDAACVLAAAGVVTHLFPDRCTTPQTAFATTFLGAAAGVMVTASHNPPEYNGYKVYSANGAQIITPQDKGIAAAIDLVAPACDVPRLALAEALDRGLVREVQNDVTEQYLQQVDRLVPHRGARDAMRIVYTAMHGVGYATASAALLRAGFDGVVPVVEQVQPDGNFPTVRFPNPEEPGAMDLSFRLAELTHADLIIANDPDADRLSIAVPKPEGGYVQLTGNQVGVLLGNYVIESAVSPPADRLVVTTIVSSPMLGTIAAAKGIRFAETLTGFKWIANEAIALEKETGTTFVFGYEEALGYTVGTAVRDKDGVSAAAVFAHLAAHCREQGRTVLEELERLHRQYGLYLSRQCSLWLKGIDGAERIAARMAALRAEPTSVVGGLKVVAVRDYQSRQKRTADGRVEPIALPPSNVLAFDLEGGNRAIARPSGTEPKLKFYLDVREAVEVGEPMAAAVARATARLDQLEKAFVGKA